MFASTHKALEWSYRMIECPIINISSVNDMRGFPPVGEENELLVNLTPYELRAQAAKIISFAETLQDRASGEYLAAKFGGRAARGEVKAIMRTLFAALGTGMHNRRAVYLYLRMYFGAKIEQEEVRKLLGCSNAAAITIRRRLFDALDALDRRAMAEIGEQLERRGLVRVAMYA